MAHLLFEDEKLVAQGGDSIHVAVAQIREARRICFWQGVLTVVFQVLVHGLVVSLVRHRRISSGLGAVGFGCGCYRGRSVRDSSICGRWSVPICGRWSVPICGRWSVPICYLGGTDSGGGRRCRVVSSIDVRSMSVFF